MSNSQKQFLGDKLTPEDLASEKTGYTVSLIPFEETTTFITGTASAPEAIVDASGHIELFDEALELDASTSGIATLRPTITDLGSIAAHAADVRKRYPDSLPGFLGGEHSITPALLQGLAFDNIGIVWIDAHADLRTEYMGSPQNHACAARNSLPFGKIVQIGIRSLAEEEYRFLKTSDRVVRFREWGSEARAAIAALPDTIYLSVDVDGLNPELIRAVGTPEPGGLEWTDILDILDFINRAKRVAAYDVVELCPSPHDVTSEFTTARLVYKIISYHALHTR
jgi:agmatinase